MPEFVCDSSSLISLSETCNIDALRFLKASGARFVVPPSVRDEIVTRPLQIRRLAFSAMRLRKLIYDKILEVVELPNLERECQTILALANKVINVGGRPLTILQEGEVECLALMKLKGFKNLVVDEKTARLLLESPQTLFDALQSEFDEEVTIDQTALGAFKKGLEGASVLRSAEIIAVSADKGFFKEYGSAARDALSASLYALQNAGCSISTQELGDYEALR